MDWRLLSCITVLVPSITVLYHALLRIHIVTSVSQSLFCINVISIRATDFVCCREVVLLSEVLLWEV